LKTNFDPLKHNATHEVPLICLRIVSITLHLLTTLITFAMSGLIQVVMAYIRLSTASAYDSQDIFIIIVSLLGLILKDILLLKEM